MKIKTHKLVGLTIGLSLMVLGTVRLSQEFILPELPRDQRLIREITPKAPPHLRFICTGDVHKKIGNYQGIFTLAREKDVDFVLLLGDLAHHETHGFYHLLVKQLHGAEPPCPVFILPGNHDIEKGGAIFRAVVGADAFTIETDKLRVICLNKISPTLSPTSWDLLQSIAEAPDKKNIIASHAPLNPGQAGDIQKYISVAGFFCGHLHNGFQERSLLDIPVWEVPGGGGHPDQQDENFAALVDFSEEQLKVAKLPFESREGFLLSLMYYWHTKIYLLTLVLALGIAATVTSLMPARSRQKGHDRGQTKENDMRK